MLNKTLGHRSPSTDRPSLHLREHSTTTHYRTLSHQDINHYYKPRKEHYKPLSQLVFTERSTLRGSHSLPSDLCPRFTMTGVGGMVPPWLYQPANPILRPPSNTLTREWAESLSCQHYILPECHPSPPLSSPDLLHPCLTSPSARTTSGPEWVKPELLADNRLGLTPQHRHAKHEEYTL